MTLNTAFGGIFILAHPTTSRYIKLLEKKMPGWTSWLECCIMFIQLNIESSVSTHTIPRFNRRGLGIKWKLWIGSIKYLLTGVFGNSQPT